ncbi:LysR family transcriptional regulator [Lactobacillus rodentium]|uniref:Malolactic regulator n=1 Tax=Lactobacillus rodentium TaxID=947835 RepID=A0A2Z6TFT8_9LACO|nr:LysR family transcriptional regulator [Lactobacillus rodentium]MCR1894624.1 LysR family transcriptional regulator [Lactobacillus rodentium]GBG04902.1 malolactic regulator [Lactobacillus rodentium]
MNIQDLRYFHALVNLKSYTKTAEKFNVSQPTITAAIKRLEKKFGGQFIIRDQSHKSIIITSLGQQFDEHAQAILNEVSVAEAEVKAQPSPDILFGLPPIIGRNYLPTIAPTLFAKGILPRLNVVERGSNDLRKMLVEGEINLTLLGLASLDIEPIIKIHVIDRYPMEVIVSKDHPFAKKDGIYFKDLAKENFIGMTQDYIHTQALEKLAHQNHLTLNTIYRSPDVAVIKSLVAKNLGVSFITTLSLNEKDNVVSIPLLDKEQPEFIFAAAMRKNHILTSKEEVLWDILTQKK